MDLHLNEADTNGAMIFKPVLCWISTLSAAVLILAWVLTIWCTMRWTYASGRWFEFVDGRLCGGFRPRSAPDFSDFDIFARTGPVMMRWGFDRDDREPSSW